MRAASKAVLIGLAAASAACRASPSDENMRIENQEAATTDIEALPPDESVATPTEELANGAIEPTENRPTPQD